MVLFCFLFSTVGEWASWEGGGIGGVGLKPGGGVGVLLHLDFPHHGCDSVRRSHQVTQTNSE
jgi:hypothetical protein